ncbi:MAG: HTH domain-containing protein [Verrucomicrobiales bacterium]
MTVKEAALEVLKAADRPLSVEEVLDEIESRHLFTFRTAGRRGVVLATLKRHATGAHSCTPAKLKVFKQVSENTFALNK